MISITKIFTFSAGHHLPSHEGKCKRFHGHNYKLEVTVSADMVDPTNRMIIDFGDLKKVVEENIIEKYDHEDLNQFLPEPTAEALVRSIASSLNEELKYLRTRCKLQNNVFLTKLVLWETDTSCATWEED